MNENRKALLHLFLISGIGSVTVYKICRGLLKQIAPHSWGGDVFQHAQLLQRLPFSSLYDYSSHSLQQAFSISTKLADEIANSLKDSTVLDKELEDAYENNIRIITILDSEYPSSLRHIYMPPLVLYVSGILPTMDNKMLAFVGSRNADEYSSAVIQNILPPLVQQGWHIVSGGALGVDACSHRTTLQMGGYTVAVLGSGLRRLYPAENKQLFKDIADNEGAVISPFPLHCDPARGNFPARNRVISGLSMGTVVIRAARRSGALITARFALEQGRHVFVVPGNIFHSLSQGCHKLLKQGATPITSAADILEEFGEYVDPLIQGAQISSYAKNEKNQQKTINTVPQDPLLKHLGIATSFDELELKTGLSFQELQDKLFELQLSGKVKQNFAGYWEKVNG